jgi:hypothetical protein
MPPLNMALMKFKKYVYAPDEKRSHNRKRGRRQK